MKACAFNGWNVIVLRSHVSIVDTHTQTHNYKLSLTHTLSPHLPPPPHHYHHLALDYSAKEISGGMLQVEILKSQLSTKFTIHNDNSADF